MPVKVKVDLSNLKSLPKNIQKNFKAIAAAPIQKAIISDIERGISPVKGKRFAKYSNSYKDVIRGKVTFRKNKQGKTYATDETDFEFMQYGKGISPVNITLSGDMIKSFYVKIVSSGAGLLAFGFKHWLADIHNNQGASKKKVIRRLLPRGNETFNAKISGIIKKYFRLAVLKATKKLTR